MNRRLELISQTLSKKEIRGSLKAWMLNCLGPTSGMLAKARIQHISDEGEFFKSKNQKGARPFVLS